MTKFYLAAADLAALDTPCLVVGHFADGDANAALQPALAPWAGGKDLPTKPNATTMIMAPAGLRAKRLLVVSLGKSEKFTDQRYLAAQQAAVDHLRLTSVNEAVSALPLLEINDRDLAWKVQQAAIAAGYADYRYTETKKQPDFEHDALQSLGLVGEGCEAALQRAKAIIKGVGLARELGDLPPNICNPEYLAQRAHQLAGESEHASIEVLDEHQMGELGMNSLLGVARGSRNRPHLIVLSHNRGGDAAPYILVGKGITFDTGGISLKPGPKMDEMKYDMGGAAAVIGTFAAASALDLPINLKVIVPAVENMPDGDAYRPGDIVTSMSGKTIEVLNTDAEGRLILCDALSYGCQFKPQAMIDVATLTGACVIALGKHASGLMSKHDDLADELLAAGNEAADRAWRLPLWDDYAVQLKSPFADLANIGGAAAGTITAGYFLSNFVEDFRWAHLDVAGSAFYSEPQRMGTGRPVGLLTQYLIDQSH